MLIREELRVFFVESDRMPSSISIVGKEQPDEVAIQIVCNYMVQQNRPYNAVDVWNNLQQKYPKVQIIKCLDIGVERGILREKLISKQKIYFVDQSKIEKSDEKELQIMNESIIAKSNRLIELNNAIKIAKNELKEYESALSIEEMIALQTTLKIQINEMEERINGMVTYAKNELINEKKKSELLAKLESYTREYKERKQIVDRIVDAICENINTSRKKLMADMGFEVDCLPASVTSEMKI
ncbi:Homologous-pairing protein [Dirofilaria immitis]